MAMNDADWVEDVKRWYLAGTEPARTAEAARANPRAPIGYEAAHPALQARHWPDAPRDASRR